MPAPETQLDKLLKHEIEICRKAIEDENREIINHFTGITKDGALLPIFTPWANYKERLGALALVRSVFRLHNVICYVHASEAWQATRHSNEKRHCQPVDDPDRQEVLIISAADKAGGKKCLRWIIERHASGRTLTEECDMDATGLGGDLLEMLATDRALQ